MKHPLFSSGRALAACTLLATAVPAQAAVLALFDFEDESGAFTTAVSMLDAALTVSLWTDDDGSATSGAGNPGLALSTRGFNDGNTLRLRVTPRAGLALHVTGFGFDQRASASGPAQWRFELGSLGIATGATTTEFGHVGATFAAHVFTAPFDLAIRADGATSALGTLRIDNFTLEGGAVPESTAVPLPGPGLLLAGGLTALGGWRRSAAGQANAASA